MEGGLYMGTQVKSVARDQDIPHIEIYDTLDDLMNAVMGTSSDEPIPEFPMTPEDITTTEDLLTLIQFLKEHNLHKVYPKYQKLVSAEDIIHDFNSMVGLEEPKAILATQVLSLCNRTGKEKGKAALINTVIYGPPGCGKTTLANFLAKLYLKFGILQNGKVIKGDRSNMIGEYVGETAIKTTKLLKEALGGVLFIDEAYQLGHAADGNRCPFAYECINTITQFITAHEGKIVVILAGYEKDIKANFFRQNDGLERRFPWEYTLKPATPDELCAIFTLQAKQDGYTITKGAISTRFFEEKKDMFKFSGGDTKTFFDKCKMVHEKRMFALPFTNTELNGVDIEKGYKIYETFRLNSKEDEPPQGMYV